jgi:ATP-dependent RNA helicase RhlE
MERVGLTVDTIHSDRLQEERAKTLDQFRKGNLKVLVATDVSARGIDIPNVDYVVNYDLPESGENYVHRVGRTGRANKKGQAVSFCSPEESELLETIESGLGKPVRRIVISNQDYHGVLDQSTDESGDWKALLANDASKKKKRRKGRKS